MPSPEFHVIITLLLHFTVIISAVTTSDLTTLIYKGCANQNFQNPIASDNLKSLYTALVSQSPTTNFFKTTINGQNNQNDENTPATTTTITGLYQCRGDLSNSDCNTCVKKLPTTIQKVCNSDTIAARAQLVGCYMRYEVFGFQQVPATELLFKKCGSGSGSGDGNGSGYDELLETALSMISKGVSNGKGYYAGGYENVYVLGQCEGDLGGGECVNCVKTAVDVGRRECRSSVSGQVFLHRCYISYTYYPNGVPNDGGNGGGGVSGVETGAGTKIGGGTGGNRKTEKAIAIVFGGLAGVGLVVALLLVLKSACKKKKEHHTYTYSYGNGNGNGNGHGNNNSSNNNGNNNGYGNSNSNSNGYGYYGYGNGNGHGGY